MIEMGEEEFGRHLEEAAEAGAKKALEAVGLDDKYAGEDTRDLRSLLRTWHTAKKTAFKTMVQNISNLLFIVLLLGMAAKFTGIFGGH